MGALQDHALTRGRLCSYMGGTVLPVIVAKSNRQLSINIKRCIVTAQMAASDTVKNFKKIWHLFSCSPSGE
jgi:hypothetical protein